MEGCSSGDVFCQQGLVGSGIFLSCSDCTYTAPVSWFASYCFHSYFPKHLGVFAVNFVTMTKLELQSTLGNPNIFFRGKCSLERESLVLSNNKTPTWPC